MLINEKPNKIYPGIVNQEIEFFFDGHDTKFFQSGRLETFDKLDSQVIKILEDALSKDEEAKHELNIMFPDDKNSQLRKFTKCRFGGLDFTADICRSGKLQQGEYWECPLRGACRAEGKICKQVRYKNEIISELEIQIIKLMCSDYTRHEVAAKLQLPFGTFDYHCKKVFKKLEVVNQSQLTSRAIFLNIIQPE